nr:FGGY-family carbohydrate kinase [Rhizobium sp. ARZ01]
MAETIAVIDIGKTNAKVVLVDGESFRELAVRTMKNGVVDAPPYPHFDTERLWAFILESLRALHAERTIDRISVATHGATAALVDKDGGLALPVLDYEHAGPQELSAEYEALRPAFAETGTPKLPVGLNAGMQLYWQSRRFPEAFAKVAAILMYAQYWSFRLTGVLAGEVTSLGCHADLWEPANHRYSTLVTRQGWQRLMPSLRKASDVLGAVRADVAAVTGLHRETPVHCGIHDSNASLLPYVLTTPSPYAVVSTGTWVVLMAMGATPKELDEHRDTLVNVNALGDPVPSARFMGGRAFSLLGGSNALVGDTAIANVLASQAMILPSIPGDSGPYPGQEARWTIDRGQLGEDEAQVAIAFHLALMSATCLSLIGADGPSIVEGPFAANVPYLAMLKAATGRDVFVGESATGTSIGAACLAVENVPKPRLRQVEESLPEAAVAYIQKWRDLADN